jgi:AhpC/TSA family
MKSLTRWMLAMIMMPLITLEVFALTLEPFDEGSLAVIKHKYEGQAFVLAFWSIHCNFCGQEMSYWRVLRRKHPGVPVVLVSMDDPAEISEVEQFIGRHNPGKSELWIFAHRRQEKIRHSIDSKWRDKLGRIYLYDVGHHRKFSSGAMNRSRIDDWMSRQVCSVR